MTQEQFEELKKLLKTIQSDTDDCYKIRDILSEIEKLKKEIQSLKEEIINEIRDI